MVRLKIAVLFGSFNPLTKAHLTMMNTAMAHLKADRGLFVATNGKYLRRKTLKINDPFYLSEEERAEMVKSACQNTPNLDFWGFELGGAIPSRYKTLCKIQRQYPDATLVELQGADKVFSILKSNRAQEHLQAFSVAVIGRNGIDLKAVLEQYPLFRQYRSSFILLPPLQEEAAISSTKVRECFYQGNDYSSLVPEGAATVLARHTPDDFSQTFPKRMQALIESSRFGGRQAGREVYRENGRLFHLWQQGKPEIPFGDFSSFLNNTRIYQTEFSVADLGRRYPHTQTGCINANCVDVAAQLIEQGYNPAILNLASARRPCGGYDMGYAAQEESLCQMSNLSLSLYQFGDPKYKNVRESGAPLRGIGYPLNQNFGGIYTPNVTFFRHNKSKYFALRDRPFTCDVITVAALSFTGRSIFSGINELSYRASDGGFTPGGEAIMLNKIRTIFRLGVEQGKDSLVLGAFGNGAYRLPVPQVSELFGRVMVEPEFAGKFRLLVFAILESPRTPSGPQGKFGPYYTRFGCYEAPLGGENTRPQKDF